MKNLTRRGQALVESVLTLPLLILAFSAILLLAYRGLVFYSVDTQLHEALICLDDESVSACRSELQTRIKPLLVFKIPFSVELRRSGSLARGEVRIEFKDLMKRAPPMIIRKEMSFPLRVSSK
jgi:hypothetical protein